MDVTMHDIGPLLTDREFFLSCLDEDIDGLREVIAFARSGDFAAARKHFAAYIRGSLQYDAFFSIPYEIGENAFLLQDETERQAADRICCNLLISCGTPMQYGDTVDWFANPTYNGYPEWTWQLSRHWEFKTLAHVYRLTGDEKYAEAFARLFESWVRQAVRPGPDVPGHDTLCWRTIECGLRMGASWPYALHAFAESPAFTDDLLVDWYKSVYEHGERLQRDHRVGNWLIMEMNGLFHIGVLYPVFKKSGAWRQFALELLRQEIDAQVYPDGFQYELSTNYHMVVINNYYRVAQLCDAYGVTFPAYFRHKMEEMLTVYVRLLMPDGHVPDLNDGSSGPAKRLIGVLGGMFPDNESFRWVLTDGREGHAPAETTFVLPYSGMIAMRSGWGAGDVYGFFESAPFGAGHQHEDKLNFLLYACGRYLLSDAGCFAYDDSEMRRYVLSTRGHNTVRVNGMDQNRRKTFCWQKEDIGRLSDLVTNVTEKFDYAAGVYDEGYGPEQDRSVTHKRSVLFLKAPEYGRPFFVITDRLLAPADADNVYTVQWRIDDDGVNLCGPMHLCGRHLHLLASGAPETAWTEVVCGQTLPEWEGWYTRHSGQRDWEPQPTARFCLRGADRRLVTVLYPDEDGTCPFIGVRAADDVRETSFVLLTADGREIALDEKDYMPSVGGASFGVSAENPR